MVGVARLALAKALAGRFTVSCNCCYTILQLKNGWQSSDRTNIVKINSFVNYHYSICQFKLAFPTGIEPVFSAPFTIKEVETLLGYENVKIYNYLILYYSIVKLNPTRSKSFYRTGHKALCPSSEKYIRCWFKGFDKDNYDLH